MDRTAIFASLPLLFLALLVGCSTQRPVLYPNERLQQVGREAANADVDHCIALAEQEGAEASSTGKKTAGRTIGGAAVGAATGAAVGAVVGSPGRGAAMGAAGGGTGGLLSGLFSSREPDPVHRAFVDRCLRDRGYEPMGWK